MLLDIKKNLKVFKIDNESWIVIVKEIIEVDLLLIDKSLRGLIFKCIYDIGYEIENVIFDYIDNCVIIIVDNLKMRVKNYMMMIIEMILVYKENMYIIFMINDD